MANSVWVGFLGSARVTTSGNDVTFPGTLSATAVILGGSNATYGGVRLKNGSGGEIVARNAIDTGNIQLLGVTASNLIELGNGGFLIRCNEPFYPGGALDLGRVTDPWANVYATAYHAGGTAGIDFNGAVTNLTVVKGIVTAAS